MILNEIGLELEVFLLDKLGNILEPSIYGFPSDEMGFLIEIRSEPSDDPRLLWNDMHLKKSIIGHKAKKLGFKLDIVPYKKVSKYFIEYISSKYLHDLRPDLTQNIYGGILSHHTGFLNGLATAGLHIHFSRREIVGNKCKLINLPIRSIVKRMDDHFKKKILEANRILGEYELKSHGFEYRSLPNNINIKEVINYSIQILEEV